MTQKRKIIVHIATSADGYIARPERLRRGPGKNIWMMGGGELIAPRHRDVPLTLRSVKPFLDGVVQIHYDISSSDGLAPRPVVPRMSPK